MDLMITIFAAIAAWAAGAVYYMLLAGPWVRVSGVQVDNRGKPANASAAPYLISGAAMVVVALMIRHVFGLADVQGLGAGIANGAAIGAFLIAPWVLIGNSYSQRPVLLTLIDGGYAVLASGIMGAVIGAT